MARWNLTLTPVGVSTAALTIDDYQITAAYRVASDSRFYGVLKVTRKSDNQRVFPYDGAPQIGPHATGPDARAAAERLGARLVAADISNPERG